MIESSKGDHLHDAISYAREDIEAVLAQAVELAEEDPDTAHPLVVETIEFLASGLQRATILLRGLQPETPIKFELDESIRDAILSDEVHRTSSDSKIVVQRPSAHFVGRLLDDPEIKDRREQVRDLQEKHKGWGIETEEELAVICDLIYGFTVEEFLDASYKDLLALPRAPEFAEYHYLLDDQRIVVSASGYRYRLVAQTYNILAFNLMQLATAFGGIKNSVFRDLIGRSVSECAGSIGSTVGCQGTQIFMYERKYQKSVAVDTWLSGGVLRDNSYLG